MAKRRSRRRSRRRGGIMSGGFLFSVISFLFVMVALVASVVIFLKVAEVSVSGTTRYDPADIIKTSGIETGDNMFLVNKFDVAERILNEYPYIEQIKIRRKLPDAFTFEIIERVPVAYIVDDENAWIIDSNAYILEMVSEEEQIGLPKVWGVDAVAPEVGNELVLREEDRMVVLKEVLASLRHTEMYSNVVRIELDKLYDVRLVYGNRFLICLGDSLSLTKKINMLNVVLDKINEYDRGTIDVSMIKEARFRRDNNIDLSERVLVTEADEGADDTGSETDEKSDESADEGTEDSEENEMDVSEGEETGESE